VAESTSYLKAAFLAPANLMALATAGIASAVADTGMPALIALGVEAVYLALLVSAPAFRRAVRAGAGRRVDPEKEAAALLDELAPSQKEHYFLLKDLRDRILANYRKLPGGNVLAASSEARLDALLGSFLRLLASLNHYRKHLNAADRATVEGEIKQLEAELATDASERVREVKRKRIEILGKRLARFSQAEESRELVSHQLAGIEDLLKLTHEQSIAIRDPESIGAQLDLLTAEAQATEESVRQMERFVDLEEITGPRLVAGVRVR
jgi:hypothetical protein